MCTIYFSPWCVSTRFHVMPFPYGAPKSHWLDTPHWVGFLWTSDQPDAETCTWQHTALTTDRPVPDNTQHSQQTDLYLTTHSTHNRQTCTWQHTALTTDRPVPDNTQHSQQTDLYLTTHSTHNRQTCTWQHTALTTDRQTYPWAGF